MEEHERAALEGRTANILNLRSAKDRGIALSELIKSDTIRDLWHLKPSLIQCPVV